MKQITIASVLAAVAVASVCVLSSNAGRPAVEALGLAAWAVPYLSFLGALRALAVR